MTLISQERDRWWSLRGIRALGTGGLTKVTAGVLVALLLAFFLVIIVNLNTVRETVGALNEGSYATIIAAGEVETSLVQLGTLSARLEYVRTPEALGAVENEYRRIDQIIRKPLTVLKRHDSSLREEAGLLVAQYEQLAEEQKALIALCRDPLASDSSVERLVRERISPLIESMVSRNTSIVANARESFTSLYDLATSVCVSTIALSGVLLGAVLIALVIFIAIIRRKTAQQKLLKVDLEVALDAARHANRAKSQFLASMSHDIRTPCSAIVGLADIAERHLEDPTRVQECLSKITLSSHHLINLINDVLDMSKIESGQLILDDLPFNMKELVNFVEAISQPQAKSKKLLLEVSCVEIDEAHIRGDALRMRQILLNLVSNAIKYTQPGGEVQVLVTIVDDASRYNAEEMVAAGEAFNERREKSTSPDQESDQVVWFNFEVEDNGIGMTAEFVEHIFEPFERDQTEEVRRIEGTGLGMSIIKNIVDQMGGLILVHSERHRGTNILVALPFYVDDQTQPSQSIKDELLISWRVDFSGTRVLLAEDNDINAEVACEIIGRTQAEVVRVSDGFQAVEEVLAQPEQHYDVIFMDVQMPKMDGLEASRTLLAQCAAKKRTCPPIIAMTANAYVEDRERAREAGMSGYVVKPVALSELCQMLDTHVKSTDE